MRSCRPYGSSPEPPAPAGGACCRQAPLSAFAAGLVLGGGIGFSDKMFGLTCDRLTATSLVLADGRVVEASEDSHPDLIHANANVNVIGQHYGSAEELRAILAPLLAIGTAGERARNRAAIREVTPAQASELLSATTPVDRFASKSAVLTSRTLLTPKPPPRPTGTGPRLNR